MSSPKKKNIKKIKKSRVFPDKYKEAYEKKLSNLEEKVKSEREVIKKTIDDVHLSKLNLSNFYYL